MAERTLLTAFSNEWTLELAGGIVGLAWDDEGLRPLAMTHVCGRFRFFLFSSDCPIHCDGGGGDFGM